MPTITSIAAEFHKLDTQLKKFGKDKCKFHKNRKPKPKWIECFHPSMSYGGMGRNTDCELDNCPRIIEK